jgi:hypothetical protein
MTSDWWPRSLAHIADEDPWALDPVTVAEIKSFPDGRRAGRRLTISALVPMQHLAAIRGNLAALDHEIRTSGPRPYPQEGYSYQPRFWIEACGTTTAQYENRLCCRGALMTIPSSLPTPSF